jgi:hypothetical protein
MAVDRVKASIAGGHRFRAEFHQTTIWFARFPDVPTDLCDTRMTALSIPNEYSGDGGMFELCDRVRSPQNLPALVATGHVGREKVRSFNDYGEAR